MVQVTDKASILTDKQRTNLQSGQKSGSTYYEYRSRIVERVRNGLHDFRILNEHLEPKYQNKIFDALPFTEEYNEMQRDVASAIQFLYVGLGGQARFRQPLTMGVSDAEVELGNVEYSSQALPRFVVGGYNVSLNEREVLELVKTGDWSALESPDLFTFIRNAYQADAIDFDKIERDIAAFEDIPGREESLKTASDTIDFGLDLFNDIMVTWALAYQNPEAFQEFLDKALENNSSS